MDSLGFSDLMGIRFFGIISNAIGELIRISLLSGDIIEGLLYSIDPIKYEYFIIKNPRRMSRTDKPIFLKENALKIFFNEIIFISCEYKSLKSTKHKFETDVDISYKKKPIIKKGLVQYKLAEGEELYKGSLEDEKDIKWDQFEVNKKKYNVESTYNEDNYTTILDRNLIPKEHKIKTEKIIKEIMSPQNKESNVHILEDRGIVNENEMDEEEKYSSVVRSNENVNS